MSPEELYRRLRDDERWVNIQTPSTAGSSNRSGHRRAREPRLLFVLVAAAAVLLAVGGLALTAGWSPTAHPLVPGGSAPAIGRSPTGAASSSASPTGAPRGGIGTVVRSAEIGSSTATMIAAASDAAFYVAISQGQSGDTWTIERVDAATGAATTRSLTLASLRTLTVGPDGLYITTSVIDKYGTKPDTILRLDPTSLRTLARRRLDDGAIWDGLVELSAVGSTLAESDGGGSVRVLDPMTLATLRTAKLLDTAALTAGDAVESPTISDGRVWVLANHSIVSLDIATLATVTTTPAPTYGVLFDTANGLVAAGNRLARLTSTGELLVDPQVAGLDGEPGAQVVGSVGGAVLEQPNSGSPRAYLRSTDGSVLGRLDLDSATGLILATAAHDAWIEGVPNASGNVTELRIG